MPQTVRLSDRLRHLGLQRRIMLFVVAGLTLIFGALAVLGLGAIDQATQLVFTERLATAYSTAAILERDFARVANDADEESQELAIVQGSAVKPGAAEELLTHFADRIAPYPFFRISGVWLLDPQGQLLDQAGLPSLSAGTTGDRAAIEQLQAAGGTWAIERAAGPVAGQVAFATVVVRLGQAGAAGPVAVCHLVSINRTTDYIPASDGRPGAAGSPGATSPSAGYHLEVVDPDGIAVLGIGSDEQPGEPSHHFPVMKSLIAADGAAAMIHQPGPTDTFAPHVMAVVPLPSSPFYVVMEQPIDIALALPNQLGQRLVLTIGLGFLGALVVAWVTTRHVVKPTEQLTVAARRMAGGDLASPIDVRADDEIGLLAESLEAMRRQLQAARRESEQTTEQLERQVVDRTARLNQVLGQTIHAQEEERRRLARELHDETAQSLAALAITLDRARDELGDPSPGASQRIAEARATADRLLAETRRLMLGLRPAILDDLGLLPAVRWYAELALVDQGVRVEVKGEEDGQPRLAGYLEAALFRIIQEAITNVAKHARAHRVAIGLTRDDRSVEVTVADDGVGFDVDAALGGAGSVSQHVGLIGMQERVRLLDGRLQVRSSATGTVVTVTVPIGVVGASA